MLGIWLCSRLNNRHIWSMILNKWTLTANFFLTKVITDIKNCYITSRTNAFLAETAVFIKLNFSRGKTDSLASTKIWQKITFQASVSKPSCPKQKIVDILNGFSSSEDRQITDPSRKFKAKKRSTFANTLKVTESRFRFRYLFLRTGRNFIKTKSLEIVCHHCVW